MTADRIYRAALHLYPRSFRERFGDEMLDFFRVRRTAARTGGVPAMVFFWLRTFIDLVPSVWREHAPDAALPFRPILFAARVTADLRDALRFLRRSPGMTMTIILLMALTIGAASSIFSVVNAVLLKPLPFADPQRLVTIWETRPARHVERINVSGHEFPVWEEQARAFERMGAMAYGAATLTGAGDPKALIGVRVTSGFFDVMGVRPTVGRTFVAQEDVPGRGQVVVLTDRLWRERFGGDPGVIGRKILLDDRPYEVVGVMPDAFNFPPSVLGARVDFWSPIAEPIRNYRGRHYLTVVARMKPDVTLEQAQSDMLRVTADLTKQLPDLNYDQSARVVPLQQDLARNMRASLLFLLGAVLCLLLIGCSNIASLLLARGLSRQQEISVRLALGSTRLGIARQLLAESILLSLTGTALGLLGTYWIVGTVPALVPRDLLQLDSIAVDRTVLTFALLTSVVTGLLFGIAPALHIRRVNVATGLQLAGRSLIAGGQPRLRLALIVGQVALTVVLALGAGLMTRGLLALRAIDLGYGTSGKLAVDVALPRSRYPSALHQRQFFTELMARTTASPGVVSAALTTAIPLDGRSSGISINVEGQPAPRPEQDRSARYRIVSTEYFKTMEIPVLQGRTFAESDARIAVPLLRWFPQQPEPEGFEKPQPPPVAIINATMARLFWPGVDPIGHRFKMLFSPWITVIGVVADTRNDSLRDPARPEVYLCDLQEPQSSMSILVRTAGDPIAFAPSMRSAIWELDRSLAVISTRTMDDIVGQTFGLPRLTSSLVGIFALLATGLMLAGIYGLMAFTTTQRLPELGLRVALGAERRQVLGIVVRQGLVPAITGIVVGLIAAAALVRVVHTEIFGVPPVDPLTWAAVTILLVLAILLACWWPARRAARVDPVIVLRSQ
jgi:putative ABC transport system permease protein